MDDFMGIHLNQSVSSPKQLGEEQEGVKNADYGSSNSYIEFELTLLIIQDDIYTNKRKEINKEITSFIISVSSNDRRVSIARYI